MIVTVNFGGERLDRIAKRTMQTEGRGTVEAILAANPGLAAALTGLVVAAGTKIRIPDDFKPADAGDVTLAWE